MGWARLLRKINLTERTSRNSIWNDTFQDVHQTVDPALGSIVQVELKDGRSVMGVVRYYSDTADECSVFLRDAQWVNPENQSVVKVDGPGILLTRNAEITSVSFLDPVK
jgi:small nuclear ribonucleoprotein (snRNP)-like protein